MTDNLPLAGQVALITGGSRGIGAASAARLGRLGAHVLVTYRGDHEAADRVTAGIREGGGSADARQLDIADHAAVVALTTELTRSDRRVDVLVANASAGYPKVPLLELSGDDLSTKISSDVRAAHLLTVGLAPAMRAGGRGRLIYIGSRHADGPSAPGMTANGVTKAALATYVRYVVDELTGGGVTANLVVPGMVMTDASRGLLPAVALDRLNAVTPAGRVATPEDVADIVAFLAVAGDMLNGAEIPVTGGLNSPLPLRRLMAGPIRS